MKQQPIIKLEKISKSFPGVQALKDVSLSFYPGEIHAVIGENGAGKSTLMKIIGGVYQKDNGRIIFNGEETEIDDVVRAQDLGISVIHQELSLIPDMTVLENLCISRMSEFGWGKFINKSQMEKFAKDVLESLDLDINPKAYVRDLKMAEKQMVEIAREISKDVRLIVMDEPTTSLSKREVKILFEKIRMLKKKGISIIYVSHMLNEVLTLADKITVMRDGCVVDSLNASETNEDTLVKLMVGRKIVDYFDKKKKSIGESVLEIRSLSREPDFSNISLNLRKGEILGISGLVGSGRTELLQAIFGLDKFTSGEVLLDGKKVTIESPQDAIELGLGFVPEDRKLHGLILSQTVKDNISLPSVGVKAVRGFLNKKWEVDVSKEYVKKLNIRTPSVNSIAKFLSGGNQQKIVVAKWLAAFSKILLLDEPTKGIDVNAKSEMYSLINNYTVEGGSVIVVSSEIPELLGIADRIVVVRRGRVMGTLNIEEATEEKIMLLASTEKNRKEEVFIQ